MMLVDVRWMRQLQSCILWLFKFFILGTVLSLPVVMASDEVKGKDIENCWTVAGSHYQIDPWLLYAIASVESANDPHAINTNRDGSIDVGLMQINSFWFDALAEKGYSPTMLFVPCTNITIGAWVLSQAFDQYGRNWRGLGSYNAGTANTATAEENRLAYARRVFSAYQRLTRQLHSSTSSTH